jgi:hypothetical protein
MSSITTSKQANPFAGIPEGHKINVCFGAGVDSTAMLVLMKQWGVRPDIITFADTGGEKPDTYEHAEIMDLWLEEIGFPPVTWCRKVTLPTTPYTDLAGNCLENETLPSLAFGMKSCSIKWKQAPQDYHLKGCKAPHNRIPVHALWREYERTGRKIVKLIGYDSSPADIRRSGKLKTEDNDFMYYYPLQQVGWTRADCIKAIENEHLPLPVKSACWFCPASQKWELFWLAGAHKDLFMLALKIEWAAMVGHHSRWDGELGSWEEVIKGDTFPSTKVTVGLGRSFSWNFWAREVGIVDADGAFIASQGWCLQEADRLNSHGGNAADQRTC